MSDGSSTAALIGQIAGDHVDGFHSVYLLTDATDNLIYIGRSAHLARRLTAHSTRSPWWSLVCGGWWVPCADAVESRLIERESIERYTPPNNVADTIPLRSPVELPLSACGSLRELCSEAHGLPRTDDAVVRFDAYIGALHSCGWTSASIGKPLGWTRQAISLRKLRAAVWPMDLLPEVPPVPPKVVKARKQRPLVPWHIEESLREMSAVACQVNGGTATDDPRRSVSVAFTEALADLRLQGVGWKEIARASGLTQGAVRHRLKRHGYMRQAPSQPIYLGVCSSDLRGTALTCRAGHSLDRLNVRLVNGDPNRRVCRTCERVRVARYRGRIRQQSIQHLSTA